MWFVTRTPTPSEVEETGICSTQISRTLLPGNVKAIHGRKPQTEILQRKTRCIGNEIGVYTKEGKITKDQNRHKRQQIIPLSGY